MTGKHAQQALRLLAMVMIIGWPLAISSGLSHNSLNWLLPLFALVFLLRLWQTRREAGPLRYLTLTTALLGATLCAASWILKSHQWLLYYPVVINLALLAVFGGSLWTSMPLVERIARLREPDLPPAAVRYTRNVTRVWCLFFIANGSIALLTAAHGDMRLWSAWNGALSYVMIGLLMAGEWCVRQRVRKREHL